MPKRDYILQNDDLFGAQLNTFKNNIAAYAGTLGVISTQMLAQSNDAAYFNYVLQCQTAMANGAQQWTAWKDLLRAGGTPPAAGAPVAPTLPTLVAAVAPGIEVRFRALVKQIKASANYNVSIGEALGIEGVMDTGPDLSTVQPVLNPQVSGNRVEVGWGWQGNGAFLDICEIQVDRGTGAGFVFLTYDTTPGYVDTAPFPATPGKWHYRAIYRVGDAAVGQWSNPVGVMVG